MTTCSYGVAVAALLIMSMVSITSGQGAMDTMKNTMNAAGNAADCLAKVPQCISSKPSDQERENSKTTFCCRAAMYSRCINNLIESTCPSVGANQIASGLETGAPGTYCEGYTFWTPECIYTNYMIAVIGSAAGLAVLLLIIVISICCCCCRSKK